MSLDSDKRKLEKEMINDFLRENEVIKCPNNSQVSATQQIKCKGDFQRCDSDYAKTDYYKEGKESKKRDTFTIPKTEKLEDKDENEKQTPEFIDVKDLLSSI